MIIFALCLQLFLFSCSLLGSNDNYSRLFHTNERKERKREGEGRKGGREGGKFWAELFGMRKKEGNRRQRERKEALWASFPFLRNDVHLTIIETWWESSIKARSWARPGLFLPLTKRATHQHILTPALSCHLLMLEPGWSQKGRIPLPPAIQSLLPYGQTSRKNCLLALPFLTSWTFLSPSNWLLSPTSPRPVLPKNISALSQHFSSAQYHILVSILSWWPLPVFLLQPDSSVWETPALSPEILALPLSSFLGDSIQGSVLINVHTPVTFLRYWPYPYLH